MSGVKALVERIATRNGESSAGLLGRVTARPGPLVLAQGRWVFSRYGEQRMLESVWRVGLSGTEPDTWSTDRPGALAEVRHWQYETVTSRSPVGERMPNFRRPTALRFPRGRLDSRDWLRWRGPSSIGQLKSAQSRRASDTCSMPGQTNLPGTTIRRVRSLRQRGR